MARAWEQCSLDEARMPVGHGGWRPGAGRPCGRTTASHAKRARFTGSVPQHVTLKVAVGLPSIRRAKTCRWVRAAIRQCGHRDDFRVVHFNVLSNHIHLVIEAGDERALARGMQALAIRIAKGLNSALGRKGRVFAERYHARSLRTPREVRQAVRYVLLNARHHAAAGGDGLESGWVDPYSSAPWFDGWRTPVRCGWLEATGTSKPTAEPRTWLLRVGWRRAGLIGVDEVPGARARSRAGG